MATSNGKSLYANDKDGEENAPQARRIICPRAIRTKQFHDRGLILLRIRYQSAVIRARIKWVWDKFFALPVHEHEVR